MDFALAFGVYLIGAVSGVLVMVAWFSDDVRVTDEDGRSPL